MAVGYWDLMQKQPTTPESFVMTFPMCKQQASQTVLQEASKMNERLLSSFMGYLSRALNAPSSQGLRLCVNVSKNI
jgi:hypothetical protein